MENKQAEMGLLVGRLILGVIMLAHGVQKFMAMEMVVGMFKDMMGLPGFLAYFTATVETVAGLALILGLFVRISAALLGLIMIGAMITVKIPMVGFFGNGKMAGWEFDLSLLGLSIILTLAGSHLFALNSKKHTTSDKGISS